MKIEYLEKRKKNDDEWVDLGHESETLYHLSYFSFLYFYVIGVVLKSFGVNNICLHSFKNFDVYVHRERVVTK